MKPNRTLRVSELIKRELALILGPLSDEFRGSFITLTEVRVSRDLRYADIWVSIMGDEQKRKSVIQKLKDDAWRFRRDLAGKVYLRRLPELRFALDTTLDYAERIDDLLKVSGINENAVS